MKITEEMLKNAVKLASTLSKGNTLTRSMSTAVENARNIGSSADYDRSKSNFIEQEQALGNLTSGVSVGSKNSNKDISR